jgi:oxygen-independent coproporphyrinogen-3 oxidase
VSQGSPAGGVYVHYPYCRHRCSYCNFVVATPKRIRHEAYRDAVLKELELRSVGFHGPARTLYFGGGTPSLWDIACLEEVISHVHATIGLREDAEITLEANPEDVDEVRCQSWLSAGINRLSLGVQSTRDSFLAAADRRHDEGKAIRAIETVCRAGFRSFSVDVMFGLEGQGAADWSTELDRILDFDIPHLSIYGLTVEPRTVLARQVERGRVLLPNDGVQHEMFTTTRHRLQKAGYDHYEVSSYARPGHRAQHNTGYWEWRPYLGLGAGAHGFMDSCRWQNVTRVSRYITTCLEGKLPTQSEENLSSETLAFERLMVGLRRLDGGVDLGSDFKLFETQLMAQEERGWIERHGTRVQVTDEGLRWMNALLLALMP